MDNYILKGLNDKQIEAITSTEGYVRVIAGAGSGKTKTLTCRYAHIADNLGISPSNLLCLTFSNKAANEMRSRVKQIVPHIETDFICTFHGFAVKILREDIRVIQYPKSFIVLDENDQKDILRDVYDDLNLKNTDLSFSQAIKEIEKYKGDLSYVELLIDTSEIIVINDSLDINQQIILSYIKKQKKNFSLDFNDLINFALYILQKDQNVLEKWQMRLQYIMIDEAQDNSNKQWLLCSLISAKHRNLFIVGDPDQAIYEWRGAYPRFLVDFDKSHTPCKTIILNENYRSTPDILEVANSIIKNNTVRIDKDLFTSVSKGVKVVHFHAKSESDEAQWISEVIKKKVDEGYSLRDIAILYRANHISRAIEQALIRNELPYVIYGGVRFYERKEIKDVLSYLRLIINGDDISLMRAISVPKRGLGKKYITQLKESAEKYGLTLYETLSSDRDSLRSSKKGAEDFIALIEFMQTQQDSLSISDFTQLLLEKSGILVDLKSDGEDERIENIQELISSMILYEKDFDSDEDVSIAGYLQNVALFTNLDYKEEKEFVKLMTIHQSKGLEFKYVFVCGLSEGILPSYRSLRERQRNALEEERRLAYVAITRAEKQLYLTESEGFLFEHSIQKYPSRFIFEIKEGTVVLEGVLSDDIRTEAEKAIKNTDSIILFEKQELKVGDYVKHPFYGIGRVIEVTERSNQYQIKFDDMEYPKPISFFYKHLEKIDTL